MSTKPEAGQWWFANDGSGPVFIVGRSDDGNVVYQERRLGQMLVSLDGWANWHHEPRCTGWDWVEPEPEKWPKYYTTLDSPSSDVAFVKRVDETSYSVVYKNGRECPGFLWVAKNQSRRKQLTEAEAMALLRPTSNAYWSYHEKHKPQPQKTRVRLWISAVDGTVYFSESPKLRTDCEIHYDSEGFYVEDQS